MQYRNMGRTGLKVSALCLGTMTFGWSADEAESHRILDAAVEAGINFFDTADVYSRWISGNQGGESETIIGAWLKQQNRRSLIIATKVRGRMWEGPNGEGLSRAHIIQACEDSLRRLQTDYIDLYQTHAVDPSTPLDETLEAMTTLVKQGKVRYVGASNIPAWMLMKACWIADKRNLARYDCLQPNFSLLYQNEYAAELEAVCNDQGIGVIPYSPLAAGLLTGKYARENRHPDTTRAESNLITRLMAKEAAVFDALDVVRSTAQAHGVPMAHVALAWCLARPGMTAPIIGARTVGQFQELVGATELALSAETIAALDEATKKL